MSMFRDLLMNIKDEGLPSEYQEVEYIQSDGNQYIDTLISGNDIGEYEIKLDTLGSYAHSWEQYFAGQLYTENEVGKLYMNGSNLVYQGFPYPRNQYANCGPISIGLYEIKVRIADGIVSNNSFKSAYSGAKWGTHTFYIFSSHTEPSIGASMRLYYLKMYTDGVKVRDYIPCYRKSDNVIGLYDLVSKTFYTNQGSGTFTKGNNI